MTHPGLQIYLRPRVNLTFEFLDPVAATHSMCLPGSVKIRRRPIVLEISRQKGFLCLRHAV